MCSPSLGKLRGRGGVLPDERETEMSHERTERQTEDASQRRVADAVRAIDLAAPAALHASIREMVAAAPEPQRARPRARIVLGSATALAAATLIAVLLVLGGGGTAAPTVMEASVLGLRSATLAAPDENPRAPGQLTASASGIPYPYWEHRFGWQAAGMRSDRLHGRTVTTVFYANPAGRRIAYSIVDGRALAAPTGGRSAVWSGVRFTVLDARGATVVTWRRAGHTCILLGTEVGARTLLRLANWQTV